METKTITPQQIIAMQSRVNRIADEFNHKLDMQNMENEVKTKIPLTPNESGVPTSIKDSMDKSYQELKEEVSPFFNEARYQGYDDETSTKLRKMANHSWENKDTYPVWIKREKGGMFSPTIDRFYVGKNAPEGYILVNEFYEGNDEMISSIEKEEREKYKKRLIDVGEAEAFFASTEEGRNKVSEIFDNSKKYHEYADKLLNLYQQSTTEVIQNSIQGEITRLNKEIEGNKIEPEKTDIGFYQQGTIYPTNYKGVDDNSKINSNLTLAQMTLEELQNDLNNRKNNTGFWKGLRDELISAETATLGISSLAKNVALNQALNQMEDKGFENMREDEKILLDALVAKEMVNLLPPTLWYNVGSGVGFSIPFMIGYGLTAIPAKALSKGIGKSLSRYISKRVTEKGVQGAIAKATQAVATKAPRLAKATQAIGQGTIQSAVQTAISPHTYSNIAERQTGDINIETQLTPDKLTAQFAGRNVDDNGVGKALVSSFITNMTESLGGKALGEVGKIIFKPIAKVAPKSASWLTKLKSKWFEKGYDKLTQSTDFNSMLSEFGEEYIDQTLNAVFVGDLKLEDIYTGENAIQTALTTAAITFGMGLLGGGLGFGLQTEARHRYNKAIKRLDTAIPNQEIKNELINRIAMANNIDEQNAIINEILKEAKALTKQGKKQEAEALKDQAIALTKYANAYNNLSTYNQYLNDQVQERMKVERDHIRQNANADMNNHTIIAQHEGENVLVVGGKVSFNQDGTIDTANSSESVTITTPDGKRSIISPEKLSLVADMSFEELEQQAEQMVWQRINNEASQAEQAVSQETQAPSQVGEDGMVRIPVSYEQASELSKQGFQTEDNGSEVSIVIAPQQEQTARQAISELQENEEINEEIKQEQTPPSNEETNTQEPQQPSYPTDESGEPIFIQMPIEQTAQVIEEFAEEDAENFITNKVAEAKKRLDKASKAKPKSTKLIEIKSEREAIKQEKQSAQAEYDYWLQVQQARNQSGIRNEELGITAEQPNDTNVLTEAEPNTSNLTNQTYESEEPQPIGVGAFGNIYNQFKGKAKEAIRFLLGKRSGEAIGALHHKDIGDIDLVWGYEGTSKSDGFGLAKLAKYHPEVLDNLQEILDDMHITNRTDNRIQLESNTHQASVRLTWDNEKKNWLLTAFEKKNSAIDNTTDTVETSNRGKQNDTATLQDTVPESKDTESVSNKQENKEEKTPEEEYLDLYLKETREASERAKSLSSKLYPRNLENAIEKGDAEAEAKYKKEWTKYLDKLIGRDIPIIDGTIENLKNTKGKDKNSARYKAHDYIIKSLQKRKRELTKTLTEEDKRAIEAVKNKGILPKNEVPFRQGEQEQTSKAEPEPKPKAESKGFTLSEQHKKELQAEATRRMNALRKAGKEFRAELNNNPDIVIVDKASDLPKEAFDAMSDEDKIASAFAKGWYSHNGKTYIILSNTSTANTSNAEDLKATLFHEAVAHKGLRELLGKDNFARLCQAVYDAMPEKERERIRFEENYARGYIDEKGNPKAKTDSKGNVLKDKNGEIIYHKGVSNLLIADEYMADLAEQISKSKGKTTIAEDIVQAIRTFLRKIGINIKLNQNDIKHFLHASYTKLKGKDADVMNTALGNKIKRTAIREKVEDGIRARLVYHGSGAEFDRFDHSYMGTGEGVQAFGWGTYVTDVEGIGRTYATTMRDKLISDKHKENAIINNLAKQVLESNNGDKEEALNYLRSLLNEDWSDKKRVKAEIKIIETGRFLPETKVKAQLYSVDIPDDNGTNYIHWETNTQELADKLNDAYRTMLIKEKGIKEEDINPDFTPFSKGVSGNTIYNLFARELGGKKQASQFLNSLGFVGISYPAEATTGGRADGARNFVIFNENDARIVEHTRFRMSRTPEEFEATQQQAVTEKGIVMPNLNNMSVNVVDVPEHDFKGTLKQARGEAKQWAIDNYVSKDFDLPEDEGKYVISKRAINKYLDETSITKSDNPSIHLSALKKLPEIISESIDAEIHPDYKKGKDELRSIDNGVGNPDLLVHRMYGAITIGDNTYRVKTTMYEFKNKNFATTPHSYEITEIELIGSPTTDESSSPLDVSTNSITATKLLQGVEKSYDKGKKILEESKNTNPDIRFRFIGEQGAINLDKAEEASIRLDNLNVARTMEDDGKDAKTIKLATGWERGADGKWRYEVEDTRTIDLNANVDYFKRNPIVAELYDKYMSLRRKKYTLEFEGKHLSEEEELAYQNLEEEFKDTKLHNSRKLKDYIEDEELFKAYPQLRDIAVKFEELPGETKGYYSIGNNTIAIHSLMPKGKIISALNHEIQHAIQHIEGFARGGNAETANALRDKARAWSWRNQLEQTEKEHPELTGNYELQSILEKEYLDEDMADMMPSKGIRDKGFNLYVRGYDNEGYEEAYEQMSKIDRDGYKTYHKLSGEVESRNVQTRLGMTPEERRQSLASETEDVSREDQIFIYDGLESTMSSRFLFGATSDELFNLIAEQSNYYYSGASEVFTALQDYYGGEIVSASWGAKHAIEEYGLIPVTGKKYSGEDGEYHHIEFRNDKGETFVESVPFVKAEDVANREGVNFRLDDIDEVNKRFNEELQQQIDGTLAKGHIYQLGMPSEILRSCGFPDMPIELSSTNLAEHARKTHHPFELEDVKDIVRALQSPIAVFSYGDKVKSQNVIVEIQKEDRNFLVGVHFNQNRRGLIVSDIRGIFPKDNAEWLNWISQGKSLYLNKEKIQALIDKQRKTLAEVEYLDLNSVTKLIKDFENPSIEAEKNTENISFRLSEQSDATLSRIEQESSKTYDEITKIELPKTETPIEIAKNKQTERTLFRFDKDFASMIALQNAIRNTELFKYNQKGKFEELNKELFDSMAGLLQLIQKIEQAYNTQIDDNNNAYWLENASSSKAQERIEQLNLTHIQPLANILAEAEEILGKENLKHYALAKAGLERQRVKEEQARQLAQENGEEYIDADYAGLTGLLADMMGYTNEQFDELAEKPMEEVFAIAKQNGIDIEQFIADCERQLGTLADRIWYMTAQLSDMQLRGQLEAGLISADMFNLLMYSGDAKEIIEQNVKNGLITKGQAKYLKTQGYTIEQLRDKGYITEEQYKNFVKGKRRYQYYLPLKGSSDLQAEDVIQYEHTKGKNQSKVRTAKGHRHKTNDPFVQLTSDCYGAIANEELNRWKRAIYMMCEKYPMDDFILDAQLMVKQLDGSLREATPLEIERGQFKIVKNRQESDVNATPLQKKEHIMYVYINGHMRTIFFKDKSLANAINTQGGKFGELVKPLQWATSFQRWWAKNLTTRNPAFVGANTARDLQEAMFVNYVNLGAKALPVFLKAWNPTSKLQRALHRHLTGKGGNTPENKLVQEYFANGGVTAYTQIAEYAKIKSEIKSMVADAKRSGWDPRKWWKAIIGWLERQTKHAELVSRIATYAIYRGTLQDYQITQNGQPLQSSVAKAIWESKEVTVNFDKRGEWSKYTNLTSLFFNAGRQSNRIHLKLMREHPKRYAAAKVLMVAVKTALPALSAWLTSLFFDDEDYNKLIEKYNKINRYTRYNNIVLLIGDNVVTIPIPPSFAPTSMVAELAMQLAYNKEVDWDTWIPDALNASLSTWGTSAIGNVASSLYRGDMVGAGLSAMPVAVLEPILQLMTNRDYQGRAIMKEGRWVEGLPNYFLAYGSTNPYLLEASRLINRTLSRTDVESAKDVTQGRFNAINNPAGIQHLATSYGGGALTFYTDIASLALMLTTSEDASASDYLRQTPIVNRFFKGNIDRYMEQDAIETYYKAYDNLQVLSNRRSNLPKPERADYTAIIEELKGRFKAFKNQIDNAKETKELEIESLGKSKSFAKVKKIKDDYRKEFVNIMQDFSELEEDINKAMEEY